nr:MAG TPA: major capsid protein [Caudoviricetes sp.]
MFKTVAEAFNFYNGKSVAEIETRAQEVKGIIQTDPNCDIQSLNIELTGLAQAKANAQEKEKDAQGDPEARSFNPVTGATFKDGASMEAVKGDVYASAEYRSAFYKSLMGKELNAVERVAFNRAMELEKRSDAYTTSGNTPVIIPTTTLNEVVKKARLMGGLIAEVRAFNVPSKIVVPVATPASKAVWNTEGAVVESDKPTIAGVSFDPNEIIKIFSISAKVKTMNIDAFESYLTDELTNCVMACLADGIVNGTGTGQGTGLETGITWNEGTNLLTTTALTFQNITTVIAKLKRGYSKGAKFAMNNTTLYNSVYGLMDANKRPVFVQNTQDDSVGKILGFEVVVDDNIKDNEIFFGNFQYYGYNMPNGIALESSTQSSFKSGKVDYRGMAIADCKPIVDEAFIKLVITPGK